MFIYRGLPSRRLCSRKGEKFLQRSSVKTSMDFLSHSGKFCITLAMAAIGLNTNVVKLVKTGGKAILMGLTIWVAISLVSLGVQYVMQMCGVMQSFA